MHAVRPPQVVVLGSANVDTVFQVSGMPASGETAIARAASRFPGGKGLNQTVAAARAGAQTTFIGSIGRDENGQLISRVLAEDCIDFQLLRKQLGETGQAFIVVDDAAENLIVVASGANAAMTELLREEQAVIETAAVLLMQLELPTSIVLQAAGLAQDSGCLVLLNAAPATVIPDELLDSLGLLVVNEHEARVIAAYDDVEEASLQLAKRVKRLIVTLGAAGAAVYDDGALVGHIRPALVSPVDTTGAGDTFCGALATAIAERSELMAAVRFATAAAMLSVQVPGAVPSIPYRDAIDQAVAELGEAQ